MLVFYDEHTIDLQIQIIDMQKFMDWTKSKQNICILIVWVSAVSDSLSKDCWSRTVETELF